MRRKLLVAAILLAVVCVALVVNSVFFGYRETRVNNFEFGGEYFLVETLLSPSLEIYSPEPFSEGMSHVRRVIALALYHGDPPLTKSGFIDNSGNVVIPLEYDDALCFSEGLAAVRLEDRWGFIDKTGEVVIPFEFSRAGPFREGLAKVERDGEWSFIDHGGNEVISLDSHPQDGEGSWLPHVWGFHEGLAVVQRDGRWGYIDREGNVVIPFQFQRAGRFSDGFAWVNLDIWASVMIDREGNQINQPGYRIMSDFSEGLAIVNSGPVGYGLQGLFEYWAFIDATGNIINLSGYHWVYPFNNGLAAVRIDTGLNSPRLFGFIDKDGELVVPVIFDGLDGFFSPFNGGVTAVALDSRWRYIDRMGNVVLVDNIVPNYDWAHNFSEGLAWVRQGDRWGILQLVPAA